MLFKINDNIWLNHITPKVYVYITLYVRNWFVEIWNMCLVRIFIISWRYNGIADWKFSSWNTKTSLIYTANNILVAGLVNPSIGSHIIYLVLPELSSLSTVPLFSQFSGITKHWLPAEYHFHIWQLSPQHNCGDNCHIRMRPKEPNRSFYVIEYFLNGEINEWSFSNPQSMSVNRNGSLLSV